MKSLRDVMLREEFTRVVIAKIGERIELDPAALKRAREEAGCVGPELARLCGWTKQYQFRLENGVQRTISSDAFEKIVAALKSKGVIAEAE